MHYTFTSVCTAETLNHFLQSKNKYKSLLMSVSTAGVRKESGVHIKIKLYIQEWCVCVCVPCTVVQRVTVRH